MDQNHGNINCKSLTVDDVVINGYSNIEIMSSNYTITNSDGVSTIQMNTGASDKTVTLPAISAANKGRIINITKNDASTGHIIITTTGGNIIRALSIDVKVIHYFETVTLQSDGATNWVVLSSIMRTVRGSVTLGITAPTVDANEGAWMSSIVVNPGYGESRVTTVSGLFSGTPTPHAEALPFFTIIPSGHAVAQARAVSITVFDVKQALINPTTMIAYGGIGTSVSLYGRI